MKTYNEYTHIELLDKIKNAKSFASTIKAIHRYGIENKINELISSNFIECTLIEKLYSIKLELIEYPKCKVCDNPAKLKSLGWSDFCNNNCGYLDRWKNISDKEKKYCLINFHLHIMTKVLKKNQILKKNENIH